MSKIEYLLQREEEMIKRSLGAAIIAVGLAVLMGLSVSAFTQSRQEVREEFHQTYPLAAGGRVSLKNINGAARVSVWDRNEVKVDAIKWAYRQERVDEAKIIIDATASAIRIRTEYPHSTMNWDDGDRRYNNPASVEYTLTIPRTAQIDSIELINGDLVLEDVAGEVRASSINGEVTAKNLTGEVKLSTINGHLEATFDRTDASKPIALSSVNGSVELILASDVEADIKASTVHGNITNGLGLPVKKGKYVGRSLAGTLGRGGVQIDLNNVNGSIRINRANDGRTPSEVRSTLSVDRDPDGEMEDSMRETERTLREAERAQREVEREMREMEREINRSAGKRARRRDS
jgi:hypothetical protein